ncbi:uncharacterized protein HGUI_01391 [Hanseniaspora guilliermondii]|uniref:Uncharacterized protein n=1 Tax=Hanseniaspora guilliermondii TaxID=56406 RepID=A0A1L0CWI3_9ASCO|nr:uncharacterized protein HGUI_01391 [Hanseniaspora guilliermondii]
MNNGNSFSGNNKHNNQNGKSYRSYYNGNKSNDNTYKKTFVNNKYNQRSTYDQSRSTYPNNVNSSSRYQGRSGHFEGSSYNSNNEGYYKKPYHKPNNYYNDNYQDQGYQSNKKYNPRRYTGTTYPMSNKSTVDALLDETRSSVYYDVFSRYHKAYKKQLEKNILSEQEFIDKFEEVKKTYMGNTKLDENLKMKLGENLEKLKLDKLQYDISILHHENIENIKGLEFKVSDDINLM